MNDVLNYLLMLYLIRKTSVTRASAYGIMSTFFVIGEAIFTGKIQGIYTWVAIAIFNTSYAIIYFEKVRNKNKIKKLNHSFKVKYLKQL